MDKDWTDKINPVLMKELRQGLRSKQFEVSLVILQILLAVLAIAELLCQDNQESRIFIQVCSWCLIGFMICGFLPVLGAFMIRSEYKANTFSTLCLTKLNAKQIVRGKWLTLILQGGLWVTTLLPYILIRYLLGGHELVYDLFIIMTLCLTAIPFMAAGVCLSAIREVVVQIGVSIVFLFLFWVVFGVVTGIGFGLVAAVSGHSILYCLIPIGVASFLTTFALLEVALVHTSLAGWGRTFRGRRRPRLPA